MKKISGKRKKTDADHEEMSRIEFLGSLYMGKSGPVVPAESIEACLIGGAKKIKRGPDAKSGLYVDSHPGLKYHGPKKPNQLWADERFRSRVGAKVGQARIMRTRPIFHDWSIAFHVEFEDEILDDTDVIEFAKKAGAIVGIGDWRPKYGRFSVAA